VSDRYDLVVLGAGTAGLVYSLIAAGAGAEQEPDRSGRPRAPHAARRHGRARAGGASHRLRTRERSRVARDPDDRAAGLPGAAARRRRRGDRVRGAVHRAWADRSARARAALAHRDHRDRLGTGDRAGPWACGGRAADDRHDVGAARAARTARRARRRTGRVRARAGVCAARLAGRAGRDGRPAAAQGGAAREHARRRAAARRRGRRAHSGARDRGARRRAAAGRRSRSIASSSLPAGPRAPATSGSTPWGCAPTSTAP